jgi:hypothetical protein
MQFLAHIDLQTNGGSQSEKQMAPKPEIVDAESADPEYQ